MNDKESPLVRPIRGKQQKPKWRQPYHEHLTLNATPFWSNMRLIAALMDLEISGLLSFDSFRTLCPLWRILVAGALKCNADAADTDIMNVFFFAFGNAVSLSHTVKRLASSGRLWRICTCPFLDAFACMRDLRTIIWSVCRVAQLFYSPSLSRSCVSLLFRRKCDANQCHKPCRFYCF